MKFTNGYSQQYWGVRKCAIMKCFRVTLGKEKRAPVQSTMGIYQHECLGSTTDGLFVFITTPR